ncbi:choline dehydrogenase 7 [Physocladia obscura]|uniref:Choline dehydrogenase 7 n=1 Tax=Physocladia obscura TaxID=109957 RepID=A0AAD5XAS1_9FUNG|nr:choline dehydrogenase 7 [Physocladia obscura]
MPMILGAPVNAWWSDNEDRDLLIGTLKHGYGKYAVIASDPALSFAPRLAVLAIENPMPSLTTTLIVPSANSGNTDVSDETPGADVKAESEGSQLTDAISAVQPHVGEDDAMDVDEPKGNSAVRLDLLPTASDLGLRIRKIIAAFLRDQINAAREEQKRMLLEERAKARQEKEEERNKLKERELTKRDRLEFYRTLSSYGVETDKTPTGLRDWTRFKEISQLKKAPDVLEEYFGKLMTLCREVVSPTPGKPPLTTAEMDFITLDKAKKLIKRVESMTKLREDILDSPQLDSSIVALRTIGRSGLPEWWSTEHDKAYLIGIAKWGLNRGDLYVEDDTLPFKAIYENYLRTTAALPAANALALFWMKEAVAMKRFYALCECVLDPNKKRGSGGNRRPILTAPIVPIASSKNSAGVESDFDDDIDFNPKKSKAKSSRVNGSSSSASVLALSYRPGNEYEPSSVAHSEDMALDPLEQIRLLQDEISQVVAGVKRKRSKKKSKGSDDGSDVEGLEGFTGLDGGFRELDDAGESTKRKKKHKKKHTHEITQEQEALFAGILDLATATSHKKKKKHKKSSHHEEADIATLITSITHGFPGVHDGADESVSERKKSKKHKKHRSNNGEHETEPEQSYLDGENASTPDIPQHSQSADVAMADDSEQPSVGEEEDSREFVL